MRELGEYLTRIGYDGPTEPTLAVLTAVVAAHVRHIPFENLDPLLGVPVADLRPEPLVDKLVRSHRGGYCYEHNGLMRYMLVALGFGVDALSARVVWMNPAGLHGPPHAHTHQALAVSIPGVAETWLVDVGFGGQTLTSPIRLSAGPIQQTPHEPFRLGTHGRGYVLESLVGDVWQPLYTFTTEPRPLIDLEVGSWYVSTYPTSIFVTGLSAALVTDEARWNLRGRTLSVHHLDGPTERIRYDTAAQVLDVLAERFDINLAGLDDLPARVAQVLDS